jgi:hypothetical protein
LWEGALSEEKIVGYVSRVPSSQNKNLGLIQFMDEKRVDPDQTLKMSYIAFTPKDVNYDHSSLVKMNHKVISTFAKSWNFKIQISDFSIFFEI